MRLVLHTADDTHALGRRLAAAARPDTVVALVGDLGAGKTSLSQGVGAGLGVTDPVVSPTFVMVQVHDSGRMPMFHADLYRVESAAELQHLGLEEMMEDGGVTLVEWADRFPELLPDDHLVLRLSHEGDHRVAEISATGPWHQAILESL